MIDPSANYPPGVTGNEPEITGPGPDDCQKCHRDKFRYCECERCDACDELASDCECERCESCGELDQDCECDPSDDR